MRNRPSGDQSQGTLTSGDSNSASWSPPPVRGFTASVIDRDPTDSNASRPPSRDQTGTRAIFPPAPCVKRVWRVESSSHTSGSAWVVRSAATRRPSGGGGKVDRPDGSGDPSGASAL